MLFAAFRECSHRGRACDMLACLEPSGGSAALRAAAGRCALRVLHESAALSVRLELQLELPAVTLFSSSLVRRPASETRDGGWSNVLRFSTIRARVCDGVAH